MTTKFNTVLGASELSANLYCNSRTSVLGRLRDYLRLLMKRSVAHALFLSASCDLFKAFDHTNIELNSYKQMTNKRLEYT